MKNKQYFYLVAVSTDVETYVVPNKITLQENEAVKYGRRLATSILNDGSNNKVRLYRQPITRNGVIEFLMELKPYDNNSKTSRFGNYDKSNTDNRYLVHWISKSGMEPTLVSGKNEFDALNKFGYDLNTLIAVDWIEQIKSEDFIETPCGKISIIKGKQIGALIQPHKVLNNNLWCTGISFMDGTSERFYYDIEKQAKIDWEYLKEYLFK